MRFPRPAAARTGIPSARAQAPRAPQRRWQPQAAATTQQEQQLALPDDMNMQQMGPGSPHQLERPSSLHAGDSQPLPHTPPIHLQQAPTRSGGALSLAAAEGQEQEVPRTLPHALAVFFTHPSSLLILAALAGLLAWRCHLPLHAAADGAVAACVAAGWAVQEWLIHNLLLHSERDWVGRRIHVGHHQRPYYHVSPPAFSSRSRLLLGGPVRAAPEPLLLHRCRCRCCCCCCSCRLHRCLFAAGVATRPAAWPHLIHTHPHHKHMPPAQPALCAGLHRRPPHRAGLHGRQPGAVLARLWRLGAGGDGGGGLLQYGARL